MGQAGRQRPQRGELLALAQRGLHAAETRDDGADDPQGGIGARREQIEHRLERDAQHLGLGKGPHRRHPLPALQGRQLPLDGAGSDAGERDLGVARALGDFQLAGDHHVEVIGLVALDNQEIAGMECHRLRPGGQSLEVVLRQVGEERAGAQGVERQ